MRGAKKVMNRRTSVRPKECVFERERERETSEILLYSDISRVVCIMLQLHRWDRNVTLTPVYFWMCVCVSERGIKFPFLVLFPAFCVPAVASVLRTWWRRPFCCYSSQNPWWDALSHTHTHKPQHTHTHTFVFIYLWGHLIHIMLTIQNEGLNLTVT